MNRRKFLIGVLFLSLISMAAVGCAEGGEAADVDLDGSYDIGGYQLYLQCYGSGRPVVLLESAYTGPSNYWLSVFQVIKQNTRVCRYDRAGLGKSEPSPKSPRSTADMVDDLHKLLAAADVSGPFVMAGHSLGGLINLIYADTYPGEVVGIVLVDSATSNAEELRQQLGEEFDYELPEFGPFFEGGDVDLELSRAEAAAVTELGDMPLVILSAADPYFYPDAPEGYSERDRELFTEAQLGYLDLSTNSRHAVVAHTWHGTIVNDGFSEVSGAILDVVAQVRGK